MIDGWLPYWIDYWHIVTSLFACDDDSDSKQTLARKENDLYKANPSQTSVAGPRLYSQPANRSVIDCCRTTELVNGSHLYCKYKVSIVWSSDLEVLNGRKRSGWVLASPYCTRVNSFQHNSAVHNLKTRWVINHSTNDVQQKQSCWGTVRMLAPVERNFIVFSIMSFTSQSRTAEL